MDTFMARMLERSKAQRSQLPDSIANNALLRERQLLEAYYSGLKLRGVELPEPRESGEFMMQPVFKVPTTKIRSPTKYIDRPGKENKSPSKEIRKSNLSFKAPRSSELYPRRPPRSVYNSPLLQPGDEAPLIYEKRYKPKIVKVSPRRSGTKENRESVLNIKPTDVIDYTEKVQNTEPETFQILYPSLPKINTSYPYDLETTSNLGSLERNRPEEEMNSAPLAFKESPAKNPIVEDVNICSGGVKKMIEKFSQSSIVPNSPSHSPARIPSKFDNFSRSPLASSTVNSPVKSPSRPVLVEAKLYHILEPSKPELRDIKMDEPAVVETRVVPAPNEQAPFSIETFEEKRETFYDGDSEMSVASSESVPVVQTSGLVRDSDPHGFLSLRLDNTEKNRRPVLDSSIPLQTFGSQTCNNNDRVKRLTMEASIQRSLVAQTSKALYLCRTEKQFKDSRELVEGERILLLASLRSHAAQEEIKKCAWPSSDTSASKGSLTISDIFVPLKWNVFPKLDRNICSQWFVCVLTMNETVQATEVVQLVDNQAMLKFRTMLHLPELSSNFRARLQLYAFRTPHFSPNRKNRIMRACKILRRPTRNCLGPAGSSEELMYIKSPAFTMVGSTELTVRLIGQEQPVSCSLEQVPMVSLIKGTINFRLSAQLTYTRQHSGFLNVLRPAGEVRAWQRWWCHLDGKIVRCWNYPTDQEKKEPVFSIYLVDCVSEKAVPAPRVLCPRPRTIMLESLRCRGPEDLDSTLLACCTDATIVRHFLSCDSASEMTEWTSAINECLDALHTWNTAPETSHD